MRLHASIDDFQADVELDDEDSRVLAKVGGREYQVEVHESADGLLLVHNGQVHNCRVEGRPESGSAVDVVVGTTRYSITLTDPKRLRTTASAGTHGDEAARIVAPMPGKVVRLLVENGATVEAGAGIVVVEAMKMQNEMKAPKAGTVAGLNVAVGSTVNGGDVLAVIE